MIANQRPILVIGGGIAGMTAAVEAAEVGYSVILVEREAYLGGRVVQMNRYFPKMCPPTCGFEVNARRIRQNPRIAVFTQTTVNEISGKEGNFTVMIQTKPKYVTGAQPIEDSLIEKISSERISEFNYGMNKTKALYKPHNMAYPNDYLLEIDKLSEEDSRILKTNSLEGTFDFDAQDKKKEINVGAIIFATGWHPYEAEKLNTLGFGQFPNVLTNVMMERLAAQNGPTNGEILRPSDDAKAENVAFVQCAGSRDENHLPYCSAVCCMASLKQARFLREKNENSKATVFYIDIRTIGRHEKFYLDMLDDENISFVKGKVASIDEDAESKNLILNLEDTIKRDKLHLVFDLVVLATGMVPNTVDIKMPYNLPNDNYNFINGETDINGIYSAGCAKHPCDVSRTTKDSTAAALKAIQCLNGGD